jgi:transposase
LLDFSAIFGLTARILGQKAEISIPGNEEPKLIVSGMSTELMPNAEVVGDRFHVMKQVSDELDRERRKIKRESDQIKNQPEKKSKLAALTHSKYA